MTKEQAFKLISKLLTISAEQFADQCCNDLPEDFYDGIDKQSIKDLHRQYYEWLGEPEAFENVDSDMIGLISDEQLMSFFADYLEQDINND